MDHRPVDAADQLRQLQHQDQKVLGSEILNDLGMGRKIPKGTEVLYSLWFAHRRCERPEEFVLERFARHRSERGERFFPFGIGPKRCVGEHLAMTVLCTLLATLLTRGRVESSSQTLELGARTVLVPKRPLKLKFRFDSLLDERQPEED